MITLRRALGVLIALNVLICLQMAVLIWLVAPGIGRPFGSLASVLQKVRPAVVTLRVVGEKAAPIEFPARGIEAPLPLPVRKESFKTGGSGVIVDAARGYILTNNHVVENAVAIDVGISDGRHFRAQLVGRDIGTDLALLKIDPHDLPAIAVGNSDRARVGDVVVAVGSPFGLEGTATMGIVSAVMRTEIGHEAFEDYLQIDAQINKGNSGGALVNARGELIGINTVIAGGRGQGFTIGFAIPINMAMVVQEQIRIHGRMRRGFTGLIVKDLRPRDTNDIAGLSFGAVVERVIAGTSAAAQGMKAGDIIVQVGNKPVRSAAEFMTRVSMVPVGSKVPVLLHSDGRKRRLALDVLALPMEAEKKVLREQLGGIGGLVVGDILPGNPLYGIARGVEVAEVPRASGAYAAGLEPGDVIIGIDGDPTPTADDLVRRLEQAGLQYRLEIIRDGLQGWLRMSR
ncbi:MAG: trypsin-like peptidase domain-containing protein [Hyphomicrobiaceae bacterium]